jgi:UDP-N-acetylglucosamine:LPS N-acetylglucosamine transferase
VLDVMASCDAILTKPGYGTFAEAACNGIPLLYVQREDWPESVHLVDWLRDRVPVRAVAADDLAAGRFAEPLRALFADGIAPPVAATGIAEAADLLQSLLPGRS